MSTPTTVEAVRNALADALAASNDVTVLGEDVVAGGPFGVTKGLAARFGHESVRNTPISESSVMGVAVGLALAGRKPFVDLMFSDFISLASDQLFNHAAKIRFMSGGRCSVPLVVWTIAGAGTRWGAQHSQRLDGWFTQVAGLKVLAPSTPSATASAVKEAIADPDPVVIIADRALLYSRDELPGNDTSPWKARLVRRGDGLTVASTGRLVHLIVTVADELGLDADVIDLQRLAPADVSTIVESVRRTSKLLIVHDEAACGGYAAGLAHAVHEQAFQYLDAPIKCLTSPPTPVPAAPSLEDAFVLDKQQIQRAMTDLRDH